MSARAPRINKTSKYGPYAVHINDGHGDASLALEAGERLGGPMRRRRGRTILKLVLATLLAGGGGWAWFNHQPTLAAWSSSAVAAISSMLSSNRPATVASSQQLPQEPPALPPLETRETPPATLVPSSAVVVPPPNTDPGNEEVPAPVEKLPPAVADPTDPLQVRALAAGLHPGLSRALLARLSDADYRNAKIAIDTALAETPDKQVFVYPRTRKPELALFQVKFVRGITPDCRRYVVMVTKDGWLTTAMPMEKCGVRLKQARKGN